MNWRPILVFVAWLSVGWVISNLVDPAALQLYVVLTAFALIFTNFSERRGGTSAYSVFNENCRPLLGQIQAEQFDNEVRHRTNDNNSASPTRRISPQSEHQTLLENTRREILEEQRKARRSTRILERPRRRR